MREQLSTVKKKKITTMTAGEEKKDEKPPEGNADSVKDSWAIRPCELYWEEYDDCTSFKARFHQYFIHGQNTDCSQWKQDYENCVKYENNKDIKAGKEIVESERQRRLARLKSHYANNVWKKREAPPEDWSKPLPEWLAKKNENTFLEMKAKELADGVVQEKTFCVIM